MVEYDKSKRDRLRKRYEEAVRKGEQTFEFEGDLYLTAYAKYVLEWLDERFKNEPPK